MTSQSSTPSSIRSVTPPEQVTPLVHRARTGDRMAFDELVSLFHEDIFRMVYYRTRSTMDSEDLTQDIFLSAFRNLSRLNDAGRFRAWLFSIAVNRVRDFHRKRRFLSLFWVSNPEEDEDERPREEPDTRPGALDELLRDEFWREVKYLSAKFSTMEREVFFLRFLDQLSIKEIAEALNKSESAIKTYLYRSLKKFKDDSAFLQLAKGETL